MTGLSGCAVAEAAEEGVSVQLRLLCLEQRAEKARALRVDASAVHAARLERAVAPESLCDEDTQTGDVPMDGGPGRMQREGAGAGGIPVV